MKSLLRKLLFEIAIGGGGDDVGLALDRSEKYDIGTPSTSPMRDSIPEGEVLTPTDHSTTFAGLSSMELYVVAKAVLGADLTECIPRDKLTKAFRDCQALRMPTLWRCTLLSGLQDVVPTSA